MTKAAWWLVSGLTLALLAWGSSVVWGSKLDTTRFLTDSTRRENDHALLVETAREVHALYCAQLIADERALCRSTGGSTP